MFEVVQLKAQSHGYRLVQTEYPLMELEEALTLLNELTKDSIENESEDRWTIIPSSYHGRPFKS